MIHVLFDTFSLCLGFFHAGLFSVSSTMSAPTATEVLPLNQFAVSGAADVPVQVPAAAAPIVGDVSPEEQAEVEEMLSEQEEPEDLPAERRPLSYAVPRSWEVPEPRLLRLEQLGFDSAATSGQIRTIEESEVAALVRSLRSNPPTSPLRVVVWQVRTGVPHFLVLGGQHGVRALQVLREEMVAQGRVVPPSVGTVEARVLLPDAPVHVRELYAGDHQQAQTQTTPVPLWRVMTFLVRHLEQGMNDREALRAAIQKSGRQRPTTEEEMRKKWRNFYWVAEALRGDAPGCIRALESKGPLAPGSFLCLRPLVTPEARKQACDALRSSDATLHTLKKAAATAARDMYVSFSWRQDNPLIAPEKCMYFPW